MVRWLVLAAASVPLLSGCISGCSDATGAVHGGEPLLVSDAADPCANLDTPDPKWKDLYACYFAPGKQASCAGLDECHSSKSDRGVTLERQENYCPQFHCGSQQDCYEGFVNFNTVPCFQPTEDDAGDAGTGDAGEAGALDATAADSGPVDSGDAGGEAGDAGEAGAFDASVGAGHMMYFLRGPLSGTMNCTDNCGQMPCTGAPLEEFIPGDPTTIKPNCNKSNGYRFTDTDLNRIKQWIHNGAPNN
jgi:hypothetical protein